MELAAFLFQEGLANRWKVYTEKPLSSGVGSSVLNIRWQCSFYRPWQRNRSFLSGICQAWFGHHHEDDVTCPPSAVEGAGGEELSSAASSLQKSGGGHLSPAAGMYWQALLFPLCHLSPLTYSSRHWQAALLSRMVPWKSNGWWPPPGPSTAPNLVSQVSPCKRTSVSQQSPGPTCRVRGSCACSKHTAAVFHHFCSGWITQALGILTRWEKKRPGCQPPLPKSPAPGSWEDHEYSSKHWKRQPKTQACSTASSGQATTVTCPGGMLILQLQPEKGKRPWLNFFFYVC